MARCDVWCRVCDYCRHKPYYGLVMIGKLNNTSQPPNHPNHTMVRCDVWCRVRDYCRRKPYYGLVMIGKFINTFLVPWAMEPWNQCEIMEPWNQSEKKCFYFILVNRAPLTIVWYDSITNGLHNIKFILTV